MTTLKLSIVCVLAALCLCGCKDEGTEEVLDVFDAYNAAYEKKDGDAFIALIDDKYFVEIDRILVAARTYTHDKVFRMQAWERWWICAMRNRLTREELAKLDGRSFVKLTVDRAWGLDDLEGPTSETLGTITFKPPRATAELLIDGIRTGLRYEFVKIDNAWKIDPMCEEEYSSRIIEKLARATGMREDTWIKNFERAASGKNVTEAIWDPQK